MWHGRHVQRWGLTRQESSSNEDKKHLCEIMNRAEQDGHGLLLTDSLTVIKKN